MSESTFPGPEPSTTPTLSPELLRSFATSPAALGLLAGRGKWKLFRHLELLNKKLLEAMTGKISRLMILTPPQVGKSSLTSCYAPAFYVATFRKPVLLASYEHDFAAQWGRRARNVLEEFGEPLWGARINPE